MADVVGETGSSHEVEAELRRALQHCLTTLPTQPTTTMERRAATLLHSILRQSYSIRTYTSTVHLESRTSSSFRRPRPTLQ
jgi:hypothetical protein